LKLTSRKLHDKLLKNKKICIDRIRYDFDVIEKDTEKKGSNTVCINLSK